MGVFFIIPEVIESKVFCISLSLSSQGIWSCIHGVHIDMKKKAPELDFSPQANMLHLLKSAKSMALSSPKRNTVLVQPSIMDVMTGKGTATLWRTEH